MSTILFRLSAVNYLALLSSFAVGLTSFFLGGVRDQASPVYMLHFFLGLFTVLCTLALHCLVFIYFLGTGRWVKEVAIAYRIPDQPWPKLTRELKRQTFPPALFAMLIGIGAAAAGEAAHHELWPWHVHLALGLLTLLVNLWAFRIELRNVTT